MSLLYTEQNILDWRVALFESASPYILISNILSDAEVDALQHRWRHMPTEGFAPFVSNVELNVHSPNYCNGLENVFQGFYMLPWNKPVTHFTHELCLEIHRLRNRLEGNPAFSGLFLIKTDFYSIEFFEVSTVLLMYQLTPTLQQTHRQRLSLHTYQIQSHTSHIAVVRTWS